MEIQEMIKKLKDADPEVRFMAVGALSHLSIEKLRDARAVEPLITCLKEEDEEDIREEIAGGLCYLAEAVIPVIEYLRKERWHLKEGIGDPDAPPEYIEEIVPVITYLTKLEEMISNSNVETKQEILKKLNEFILNNIESLEINLMRSWMNLHPLDERPTIDDFVLEQMLSLYKKYPSQFKPFINRLMDILHEAEFGLEDKTSYRKEIARKIITFFASDRDFQKVLDVIGDANVLAEIKRTREEIMDKVEESRQQIIKNLSFVSKNIETFYNRFTDWEERHQFYDNLIQFTYEFNNLQTAIPIISKIEEKPEKITVNIFCPYCHLQTEVALLEKEKKSLWERIKTGTKKFLRITTIICSFTSIIGGVLGIIESISEFSNNPRKNALKIAEKFGLVVDEIDEIVEAIKVPTQKEIEQIKKLPTELSLNKLRFQILSQIHDPEAEKLLKDLIDKNVDVQTKFKKDISGFYAHKNCQEYIFSQERK